MTMPGRLIPLIPLLGWLPACGAGDVPAAAGVRVDTVGGVIHIANGERGAWEAARPWRADDAGAIEIGEVDGPEPYVFGAISGVVVGGDGRIYVADAQAKEVRIFSPEGEFLDRFGRDGEGPGEFRNISGLGRGPDGGIATLDGSLGRVSIFDGGGTFVRSFRLERPYMILFRGAPVRFDRAGRFYDVTPLSHGGIGVDTTGVVRYSPDGQVEDTVLTAVYTPERAVLERSGVAIMSFAFPFWPEPSAAVGTGGVIYATAGREYRISQLGPAGDTLRVIRRTFTPPPVSAAERDTALAWIETRVRAQPGTTLRGMAEIPERKPAIATLRVDDPGYLWVLPGGSDPDPMAWDVFDPDGRYLGAVAIPTMSVMHIGERTIAGVVRDELGVAKAKVIPLDRG